MYSWSFSHCVQHVEEERNVRIAPRWWLFRHYFSPTSILTCSQNSTIEGDEAGGVSSASSLLLSVTVSSAEVPKHVVSWLRGKHCQRGPCWRCSAGVGCGCWWELLSLNPTRGALWAAFRRINPMALTSTLSAQQCELFLNLKRA